MTKLIKQCLCGNSTNFKEYVKHDIPVRECTVCGTVHQNLDMTPEEYFGFYEQQYHSDFQSKRGTPTYSDRLQHDQHISELRLTAYADYLKLITPESPALDIGSSNNAFVDSLKQKNLSAYGIEIGSEGAKYPNTTYTDDLLKLNFPPNKFGMITLHDVLEHFIDPVEYMNEINRIVAKNGVVIIDLPNFYVDAGIHHWKPVEHLWFFSDETATKLFNDMGFVVERKNTPIPSKVVYYLRKKKDNKAWKKVKPLKMLFMPGMGDIYWCLTKVESFIKKHDLPTPEAYIWDLDQKKIGDKQRSENFLNMFPFLDYKGTLDKRRTPEFDMFYAHKDGPGGKFRTKRPEAEPQWIVRNFGDFDYVFNVNGILEIGESIVDSYSLKDYETNWEPTRFVSVEEEQYVKQYTEKYGKYIFCYFTGVGVYNTTFNNKLTVGGTYNMLKRIHRETGAKIVLTGTTWDSGFQEKVKAMDKEGIIHSEINQTNTTQLMALMRGSVGVIGWPAGNTIVAASNFKKPTIMVWSKELWDPGFAEHCVDPTAVRSTYRYHYVEDTTPQVLIDKIVTDAKELFNK